MRNRERFKLTEYLGDGVFAGWDGFQVVLFLEEESAYGPNAICLEPLVLLALDKFRARVREEETRLAREIFGRKED